MNKHNKKTIFSDVSLNDITMSMNVVKINNNSAIIYSRVSTFRQQNGTSLESQKILCQDYCNLMNFNVIHNIEEVCSATQMSKQSKLNNIIMNNNNINIVILEPSRLCRNIKDFTILLNKCNEKNIIIHFTQTNISSNNSNDIKKMISSVYDAELESKTLSQRIKRSVSYRKQMKLYVPSVPSFGFMIKDKKKCLSLEEQNIITLINKLYWGSDTKSINDFLYKITGNHDEICNLYDNVEIIQVRYGNLRIIDIAHFLNNLEIKCRGKKWYCGSVSRLIKR